MIQYPPGLSECEAIQTADEVLEKGLLHGMRIPSSYRTLEEQSLKTIHEELQNHPNALKMFGILQNDPETSHYLSLANYIAVRKLGYNDHGPIHAKITAANALKLLRIILDSKELPLDSTTGLGMNEDDAHLIVTVGGYMHDIGNAVHREEHEMLSLILGKSILERLLPEVYPEENKRTAVLEQVLHILYSHDEAENALTMESAIVVIADGCDITKGRGRLSYDLGKHDIHSISALSIENVEIRKGQTKLIEIYVEMSNSAGIYQVQETLGNKVAKSLLRDDIEIVTELIPQRTVPDQRVRDRIIFSDGKFRSI